MKSWVKSLITNAEEIVSCFFVSITVCLVIVNVIFRYVLNIGIYWSEEVATICFVWSVFIGAAACYKKKMHIGIDFLIKLVPGKAQGIINLVVDLMLIVINGYITYLSIVFIRASYIKPTAVLGISSAYVSASLLIGFGLMTMYAVLFFIKDLKGFLNSSKEVEKIKSIEQNLPLED